MNTNKKGFTLIELLVVIVIIGILATISVATFGGYFKKARDSERQSAVQNIATIMKVINATEESTDYRPEKGQATVTDNTRSDLDGRLNAQGYATPDGKNQFCYYYGWNDTADEFFVAIDSEEDAAKTFAAGTPAGVTAAEAAAIVAVNSATDTCNNGASAIATFNVLGWYDAGHEATKAHS